MNILDEIVSSKKVEVAALKERVGLSVLKDSEHYSAPTVALKEYLTRPGQAGVIAEFKRRSPSKGVINASHAVEATSIAYMQAGAAALSVLTDTKFFGGSNDDLKTARRFNFCPILRKDFTIDSYQIHEARSIGADAILLIARILTAAQLAEFADEARSLGLSVLVEIHEQAELDKLDLKKVDVLGVNNRNLDTFKVDVANSLKIRASLPTQTVCIAESGIESAATMLQLKQAGFSGFLIGQAFMQTSDPGLACARLIEEYKRLEAGK